MPSPGTAPGVTAGMDMKPAVTGEAAPVIKKFITTSAPRCPGGSLLAVRGRELVDNQDSTVASSPFFKGVGQGQAWAFGAGNGKECP